MYGELIPLGGGDSIPLLKTELMVGRRESCDIVLRFPNVSSQHCKLMVENGYWYIDDLGSSNGSRINGARVQRKRIDPGDTVTFAKHKFQMTYSPQDLGAIGPPPADDDDDFMQIMQKSLMDRAGLNRRHENTQRRHDANDNRAGQRKEKKRKGGE